MNHADYVTPEKAREFFKVSNSTLRRWDKNGQIHVIRNPSGHRLYSTKKFKDVLNDISSSSQKQKICYCRVSSYKQKDDLKRQISFLESKFPDYTIIKDIGTGINWKRSGLRTILELAMSKQLEEVVVAHRDRLCRFAFELIKWILEKNGVKLMVLDNKEHSSEQELAEDLLSIIHVFSCKQMGKRRYKKKGNGVL